LGSSDPYISGAMRPFLKDIPFTDLNYEKNYLTIVLYTNNGNYPLQFMDTIEIGESDSIYVSYTKKENLAFFFIAIYVAVGLYHILLANKRRKDLHNLYFGLFCFCVCIHFFIANTFSRDAIFQDSVTLHRKLEHIFMFPITPGLLLFLTQFQFLFSNLSFDSITKTYFGYNQKTKNLYQCNYDFSQIDVLTNVNFDFNSVYYIGNNQFIGLSYENNFFKFKHPWKKLKKT